MAYDDRAQEFLDRWRRYGQAPHSETIVMNVSNSNPFLGESITVSWQAVGPCVNILINDRPYMENQALEGQFTLDIPQDLNTLTITGLCGPARVTREIKPRVIQPTIHRFAVDKNPVYLGDDFCVDWGVADATEISITLINNAETVFYRNTGQGRLQLRASKTGACRAILLAKSRHSTLSNNAQVTKEIKFHVDHRPISIDFGASANTIGIGESVRLFWRTKNANSVQLVANQGVQDVGAQGSIKISIDRVGKHEFELIAVGFAGTEKRRVSIRCEAPEVTMELAASANEIQPGDIVGLSWTVTGAAKVELESTLLKKPYRQAEGRLKFMLSTSGLFSLTATGFDGRIVTKTVAIKVKWVPDEPSIENELSMFNELFEG